MQANKSKLDATRRHPVIVHAAILCGLLLGSIIPNAVLAQTSQKRYVIANGGQPIGSDSIVLSSTIGQALAGYTQVDEQSHGVGFWFSEPIDTIVAPVYIEEGSTESNQPVAFALHQNYPNPFNPNTRISYTITEPGPITLVVYDVLGREVHRLVDMHQANGTFELTFNADRLPSGMYLYVLTAGATSITRYMTLLK